MHTKPFTPYAQFATLYENRITITNEPIDGKRHKFTASEYHKNPTNEKYTGTLSKAAKKTIEKRLTGWIYALKTANQKQRGTSKQPRRQPIFVTLTLPAEQQHTDKQIKSKCLELFIKALQYRYKIRNYFWRAEVQQNGNLHFHLIFDRYLPAAKISELWNRSVENLGYITRFESKHGHRNPPTTNVKKLFSNSANIWYLLKYVSKDHQGRTIDGAVFRFSSNLLKAKPLKIMVTQLERLMLARYFKAAIRKVISDDYWLVAYFDKSRNLLPFMKSLGAVFLEVSNTLYSTLYPPEEHPQPKPYSLRSVSVPVAPVDLFS